jgi:drug/metabolite transporter (DMT)-like permease
MVLAGAVGAAAARDLAVAPTQMALLAGFGAFNLGLGLALFVTGARLAPAAVAALLGVAETMLGPVWVWLAFGETPSGRTILGGAIVLAALTGHLAWQIARAPRGRPA